VGVVRCGTSVPYGTTPLPGPRPQGGERESALHFHDLTWNGPRLRGNKEMDGPHLKRCLWRAVASVAVGPAGPYDGAAFDLLNGSTEGFHAQHGRV
jgi:hypothetical protein